MAAGHFTSASPQDFWDIFSLTGGEYGQVFSILTEQLEELLSVTYTDAPLDPIAGHRSISRITLRSVLLSGLGENVHFGKRSCDTKKPMRAESWCISKTAV